MDQSIMGDYALASHVTKLLPIWAKGTLDFSSGQPHGERKRNFPESASGRLVAHQGIKLYEHLTCKSEPQPYALSGSVGSLNNMARMLMTLCEDQNSGLGFSGPLPIHWCRIPEARTYKLHYQLTRVS